MCCCFGFFFISKEKIQTQCSTALCINYTHCNYVFLQKLQSNCSKDTILKLPILRNKKILPITKVNKRLIYVCITNKVFLICCLFNFAIVTV